MLLGEFLEFVIIQIARQTYDAQHRDVTIVQFLSPTIVSRVPVDILLDKSKNLITQQRLVTKTKLLQASQDRNDFVATLQVEFDVGYALTTQSCLT